MVDELPVGIMNRHATFHTRNHPISDADIGERAAHHHAIVAAPRAILVKVPALHAQLAQVVTGRAVGGNAARREKCDPS